MKKWKKWTALLCAGAMLVSLTACGTQPAGSDSMAAYAGQSVTGQITVLDGTSVTLQIGELSQSDDMQPSDATPPEKPESDASGDTAAEDAGTQPSDATPPEKPESDASGDTAAEDAGTQPSDATLPEKPEGDATGETTEQTTGAQPSDMTLPDKPEGDDSAAMDSCICQMDMLHCILHYFRGEKKWTNNRKREVHFPASSVLYWRQRAHRSGWAIYGDSRISRQSMAAGSFCSFILSWR